MIGTLIRRFAGNGGGGGDVERTGCLAFTAETTPATPAGFTAEHIP